MTVDQALVLATIIVGLLAIWVPLHYSMRKDTRERDEKQQNAVRQAVHDATAPLAADRDYWRNKADELERELRERGGRRG